MEKQQTLYRIFSISTGFLLAAAMVLTPSVFASNLVLEEEINQTDKGFSFVALNATNTNLLNQLDNPTVRLEAYADIQGEFADGWWQIVDSRVTLDYNLVTGEVQILEDIKNAYISSDITFENGILTGEIVFDPISAPNYLFTPTGYTLESDLKINSYSLSARPTTIDPVTEFYYSTPLDFTNVDAQTEGFATFCGDINGYFGTTLDSISDDTVVLGYNNQYGAFQSTPDQIEVAITPVQLYAIDRCFETEDISDQDTPRQINFSDENVACIADTMTNTYESLPFDPIGLGPDPRGIFEFSLRGCLGEEFVSTYQTDIDSLADQDLSIITNSYYNNFNLTVEETTDILGELFSTLGYDVSFGTEVIEDVEVEVGESIEDDADENEPAPTPIPSPQPEVPEDDLVDPIEDVDAGTNEQDQDSPEDVVENSEDESHDDDEQTIDEEVDNTDDIENSTPLQRIISIFRQLFVSILSILFGV